MATINFLYRSNKERSTLILRLLYRHGEEDFVFGAKTKIEVEGEYWRKKHNRRNLKDVDLENLQLEVNTDTNKIRNHVLNCFNKTDTEYINKQWLENVLNDYYNPSKQRKFPKDLVKYVDLYRAQKANEVTPSSLKKFNVTKHKLERFQKHRKRIILIKDIDLNFKNEFENYCLSHNYAKNTIARDIRFIKSVCNHAKDNGLETSSQLRKIKGKYIPVDSIYLSDDDIDKINNLINLPDHLNNAKDWLLISCFTGQRVSDFMRFNKGMIRYVSNQKGESKPLLEFTQQKTGKIMTIPLMESVIRILEKRNGEFPHQISDQRYNEYIKEVCREAKIDELVKGSKKEETIKGSKIYRKQEGEYKKYELVTSHIGRRSFATNYYTTIPTGLLIKMTGHSTELMFLNYIGKSNKDMALELADYLN